MRFFKPNTNILELYNDILIKILQLSILSGEDVARFSAVCKAWYRLVRDNAKLIEKISAAKRMNAVQVLAVDEATFLWRNFKRTCVLAEASQLTDSYPGFTRIPLPKSLVSIKQIIAPYNIKIESLFILGMAADGAPLLLCRPPVQRGLKKNHHQFELMRLPDAFKTVTEIVSSDVSPLYLIGKDAQGRLLLAGRDEDAQDYFRIITLPERVDSIVQLQVSKGVSYNRCQTHELMHAKDIFGNSLIFSIGDNLYGQLGTGDYDNRSAFHSVTLPKEFISVTHVLACPSFSIICGIDHEQRPLFSHCGNNRNNTFTILELPSEVSKILQVEYTLLRCYLYALNVKNESILFHINFSKTKSIIEITADNVFQKIDMLGNSSKIAKCMALPNRTFFYSKDFEENPLLAEMGFSYFAPAEAGQTEADLLSKDHLQRRSLPKELRDIVYVSAGSRHAVISGIDANGLPVLAAYGHNRYGQMGVGALNQQLRFFKVIPLLSYFRSQHKDCEEEETVKGSKACTMC